MEESSLSQENREPSAEPKLFGLPRPFGGALVGVLLFTTVLLLTWMINLHILSSALLAPGILASSMLESARFSLIPGGVYLEYAIAYLAASIPPAILGSLFVSDKKDYRVFGVILLVAYFIFALFAGLLTYAFLYRD